MNNTRQWFIIDLEKKEPKYEHTEKTEEEGTYIFVIPYVSWYIFFVALACKRYMFIKCYTWPNLDDVWLIFIVATLNKMVQ